MALFLRFVPGYLLSFRKPDPLADTAKIAIELFGYASGHARIDGKDLTFYVSLNGYPDFRSAGRDIYSIFASGEPDSVFRKPV